MQQPQSQIQQHFCDIVLDFTGAFRAAMQHNKNMFSPKHAAHKQINLLVLRMEMLNITNPIPSIVIFLLLILQTIKTVFCDPSQGITQDTFILSPFCARTHIHTHADF